MSAVKNIDGRGLLRITPLWLRLILVLVIALPAFVPFTKWYQLPSELTNILSTGVKEPMLSQVSLSAKYLVYTMVMYLIIYITFGIRGFTRLLGIAVPLALVVCLTQASLPSLPGLGPLVQGSKSPAIADAITLHQFIVMITVIPLGLFGVMCFPPTELLNRVRQRGHEPSENLVRVIIVLRLIQIVTEGVAKYRQAWKEENPAQLFPRHRAEIGSTQRFVKFPVWFVGAAKTWAVALVTYSIENIPALIYQIDTTFPQPLGENDGKD